MQKRVDHTGELDLAHIRLRAAAADGNTQWSRFTPCGVIDLHITREGAFDAFTPGQEYLVDFTLCPAEGAS